MGARLRGGKQEEHEGECREWKVQEESEDEGLSKALLEANEATTHKTKNPYPRTRIKQPYLAPFPAPAMQLSSVHLPRTLRSSNTSLARGFTLRLSAPPGPISHPPAAENAQRKAKEKRASTTRVPVNRHPLSTMLRQRTKPAVFRALTYLPQATHTPVRRT